jgi:hypothetical protein
MSTDIQACQILIYHVISHHKFKPDIENTYITTILEHKVILVLYSEVICLNYEQDFKTLFYSRYNKLSHENTIR